MTDLGAWADARLATLLEARSLDRVVDQQLTAVNGSDGYGSLQVFQGDLTIVDSRLTLPTSGIDSVMLHAFAPSGGTSPHLLSDLAVLPDGRWHFHVDLLPRVDLVATPSYLDEVYPPLTAAHDRAYAIEGSTPISLPLRLRALSSPWLIGVVASPHDEPALTEIFGTYTRRWAHLLNQPPATAMVVDPESQVARDRQHRAALFDDATDPVWSFVAATVGHEATATLLDAVRTPR